MKQKSLLYFGIAIALVAGGALLAVKGQDAVSKAENRKQAALEAEQKIVVYDKNPGTITRVQATAGESVKKGDALLTVHYDQGGEADVVASVDGAVGQLAVQPGDRITPGKPIATLQKNDYYADFYVQEDHIQKLKVGQRVKVSFPYTERSGAIDGTVASVAAAPQFASLRMTREKGQADVSMFAVRVSISADAALLPGMTAEVDLDEIAN